MLNSIKQFFTNMWTKLFDWMYMSDQEKTEEGISPKGRLRLERTALAGVIFLVAAYYLNPSLFMGWFSQAVLQIGKTAIFCSFYYWCVQREAIHTRTHELEGEQKTNRENAILIGYAIVIGCSAAI